MRVRNRTAKKFPSHRHQTLSLVPPVGHSSRIAGFAITIGKGRDDETLHSTK